MSGLGLAKTICHDRSIPHDPGRRLPGCRQCPGWGFAMQTDKNKNHSAMMDPPRPQPVLAWASSMCPKRLVGETAVLMSRLPSKVIDAMLWTTWEGREQG